MGLLICTDILSGTINWLEMNLTNGAQAFGRLIWIRCLSNDSHVPAYHFFRATDNIVFQVMFDCIQGKVQQQSQ